MASILPGYEYDIFISYRRRPGKNAGVRWGLRAGMFFPWIFGSSPWAKPNGWIKPKKNKHKLNY